MEIENVFWNWAAILCSQDLWQHQLCRLSARHFITLLEGMFSILPHHLSTETSMGELGFCAFTSSPFVAKLNDSCLFAVYHVTMFNIARLQNCTKMPVGLRSAPDDDAGQTIGLKGVPGIGKCVCHKHHNLIYHHCHHHTNKASPPVVRLDGLGSHHS